MLVEAAVQGHTVAVEEQVLQRADPLQPQGPLRAVRQVGVVEEHVEAEGLSPQRHRLPHAPWGERASPRLLLRGQAAGAWGTRLQGEGPVLGSTGAQQASGPATGSTAGAGAASLRAGDAARSPCSATSLRHPAPQTQGIPKRTSIFMNKRGKWSSLLSGSCHCTAPGSLGAVRSTSGWSHHGCDPSLCK